MLEEVDMEGGGHGGRPSAAHNVHLQKRDLKHVESQTLSISETQHKRRHDAKTHWRTSAICGGMLATSIGL
eukprot:1804647-Amphidinium_carterae.2